MNNNWQKDYPLIANLSEAGLNENSSFKKMAQFIENDKHVVDFGCATGYFAQLLTEKGCIVTGIEINSNAAKIAEKYCENVIVADLDFIKLVDILPTQAFDVAVFGDVLEHLRDPWRILEETKHILKPNGYVVASIPNVAHGAVRLSLLQGKFEYDNYGLLDNTHLRFFTRKTVEELFERTGYFVDASSRTVIPVFSGSDLIPNVDQNGFSPEIIQQVQQQEDSDTLQFIIRAFPLTLEGRFTALYERYEKLVEQYKRLQSEHQVIQSSLELEKSKLFQEIEVEKSKLFQEVEADKSKIANIEALLREKQLQLQGLESEVNSYRLEKSILEEQLLQIQKQMKTVTTRFQWAQSQLKYSQSAVGGLEARVRFLEGEKLKLDKRIKRSQERSNRLQAKVEHLQSALEETILRLEAIQTSKFWKLRTAWFKFKRLLGLVVPDAEMFAFTVPASPASEKSAEPTTSSKSEDLLQKSIVQCVESDVESDFRERSLQMKMFAFISDCPGDAYRYRCQHQAEVLKFLGYTVDVYDASDLPYNYLLKHYQIVIVHRVPHTHAFEQFVTRAEALNIKIVFDTDDLIFQPSQLCEIDAYMQMEEESHRLLYADGVRRYHQSMTMCRYAVVSTDKLKQEVEAAFPEMRVIISRNCVSQEMKQYADDARTVHLPNDGILRIGYFSGTKTHAKDFAECVVAVKEILQEFSYVHLMVVGHLDVPEELQELKSQIEYIPLVPWQKLPLLYRRVDINLAPLELNNSFTEAKSELKYFEAGLLSVPTIASDLPAFQAAIQNGINGNLCKTQEDWKQALRELVLNPALRGQMGQAAFTDVVNRYLTRTSASVKLSAWQQLLGNQLRSKQPLSIAFVLRAPIAQTGGGYKQLFNLAHYLSNQGHDVHIYVEPIAHLAGLSLSKIRMFCEEHFGKSQAKIYCGYDEILPSDVAIATNWPTAYVVDKLVNTRFRAYYVQDYEPYFYQTHDPYFAKAETTYDLPLGIITIGRYLASLLSERNGIQYPHTDFSLNPVFLNSDPELNRHQDSNSPCSVLFFARPNIPRRNFSLGVKALEMLYQQFPNVKIQFYGMEEDLELPFPYENLGILDQAETAAVMRSSSVHLSFSMTNITTVIFEAMACGCATVEVDVPAVRGMVKDGENCLLAKPNAKDVCDALLKLLSDLELRQSIARSGFDSVKHLTIANMCRQFEEILLKYSFRAR